MTAQTLDWCADHQRSVGYIVLLLVVDADNATETLEGRHKTMR